MRAIRVAIGAVVLVLGLTTVGTVTHAADARESAGDLVSWGAAVDTVARTDGGQLRGRTVRNLLHTSVGGPRPRIVLSNEFGTTPVTFNAVSLARAQGGAAVSRVRNGTFGGKSSVTISPGAQVRSDPLRATLPSNSTVAVSLSVKDASGPVTGHNLAMQRSYISAPGDRTREQSAKNFDREITSWYWVKSIELPARSRNGTVAFLGDSITDGAGSTVDANRRYPDQWFDRYQRDRFGVLNVGISANRVFNDSAGGPALRTRLKRDVFDRPGVRSVVLLAGINDIRWDQADATSLAREYRNIARPARKRGICVAVGTLTPFEGGSRYSPEREQIRSELNQWLRAQRPGRDFDSVIDFDAATRDPARTTRLLPQYDSGDQLHPSDAGYAAMARLVTRESMSC